MMEKRNGKRNLKIGKVKLVRYIVFPVVIALLCGGIAIQECMAAEGDEEEIEKVIEDFRLAWNNKNMAKMGEVWSHEDDVRFIIYTTLVPENNHHAHGWSLASQLINSCFWFGSGAASFHNLEIDIGERGAAVVLDSNIGEPHSDANYVFLREEDDCWKICLWDVTCIEANKTGDEAGEYVEIAFEAEDGIGAAGSVNGGPDASGGRYILNMGRTSFEFSLPEEGEYTFWGRTHAPSSDDNSFHVTIDNISNEWDVGISSSWAWNQMNFRLNMGPKILKLEDGVHIFSLQMREDGTKLDAIYITNNLSLRADQIQRRFELTMGYVEEPEMKASLEPQGNMITTWGRIKR